MERARNRKKNLYIIYFIEVDGENLVHIHHACAGAGLGGFPYRDGSYDYYISEKTRSNDPKVVRPFILLSLEYVHQLQ